MCVCASQPWRFSVVTVCFTVTLFSFPCFPAVSFFHPFWHPLFSFCLFFALYFDALHAPVCLLTLNFVSFSICHEHHWGLKLKVFFFTLSTQAVSLFQVSDMKQWMTFRSIFKSILFFNIKLMVITVCCNKAGNKKTIKKKLLKLFPRNSDLKVWKQQRHCCNNYWIWCVDAFLWSPWTFYSFWRSFMFNIAVMWFHTVFLYCIHFKIRYLKLNINVKEELWLKTDALRKLTEQYAKMF